MSTYMPDIATFETTELVEELKARNKATLIAFIRMDGNIGLTGSGGLPARSWLSRVLSRAAAIETELVVFGGVDEDDEFEDGEIDDADSD